MEKSIAIFCLLSIASLKVKVLRRGGVVVSVPELRPRRMEEERPPAAGSGAGTGRVRRGGFVVWLHGLGDCGRANEFIADHFSAAALSDARWAFPTAPTAPVTCNRGMRMPSWFDIHDAPITSVSQNRPVASLLPCAASSLLLPCVCVRACVKRSVRGEEDVLRAVQIVHTMIDREIASGTGPEDVFVFGLSQGGALSIASVLLYPKTLGGCAVFSGFLPFDSSSSSSFAARVTDEAKKTPVLWIHGGADSLIPVQEGWKGETGSSSCGDSAWHASSRNTTGSATLWRRTNWSTASGGRRRPFWEWERTNTDEDKARGRRRRRVAVRGRGRGRGARASRCSAGSSISSPDSRRRRRLFLFLLL
ncbi:Carboxylesterase SOBER1 [Zea mays]|uniref:Carboxylesterase SOBER1 n=2 Tax=Zea mays TaxID=4577 RepID=A0A1D6JHK5_MAIZE|nr:Carboxylesterase SOBER1 [Zea mays]